eukprot:311898_1
MPAKARIWENPRSWRTMREDCQFEDLGWRAKSTLSDRYCTTKILNVSTSTSSGLEFDYQGEMAGRETTTKLSTRFPNGPAGLSIDEMSITSNGTLRTAASVDVDESIQMSIVAEEGTRVAAGRPTQPSQGSLSLQYKTAKTRASSRVDLVSGPTVFVSGIIGLPYTCGGFVGGSIAVNTQLDSREANPELHDWAVGGAYIADSWDAHVISSRQALEVSFFNHSDDKLELAASAQHTWHGKHGTELVVGGAYALDERVELRAKVSSNSCVSAALTQRISKFVDLTLSAVVRAKDLIVSDTASSKFGVSVNILAGENGNKSS